MKHRKTLFALALLLAAAICTPAQAQEDKELAITRGFNYTLLGYYSLGLRTDTLLSYLDTGEYKSDTIFLQQLPDSMRLVISNKGVEVEISHIEMNASKNDFMYARISKNGLLGRDMIWQIDDMVNKKIYLLKIFIFDNGERKRAQPVIAQLIWQVPGIHD